MLADLWPAVHVHIKDHLNLKKGLHAFMFKFFFLYGNNFEWLFKYRLNTNVFGIGDHQ